MDFELSKENILPLAGGRNVQQLGMALQAQTNRESQMELMQQREQWEALIKSYTGDDPLDNYYKYICWIEQTYPKHGHEGNLIPLLEHCLKLFENDQRYTNERRFCKLWIKYFDLQPNPLELYHMMKAKGLCIGCADFYRAWAYYHEAAGDFHAANNVFEEAKKNCAQPYEELENAHQNLIMAAGQHLIFGPNQCQLMEKRQALTSLHTYKSGRVGSVRVPSNNGLVTVPSNSSTSTRLNTGVNVREDWPGEASANIPEAAPVSLIAAAKRQEQPKENTLKAGPWTGTVPVKKRVINSDGGNVAAGFIVHEDPVEEPQQEIRVSKNFPKLTLEDYSDWEVAVSYPDPFNPMERPMYPKHHVYAEPNTEYSIEEVMARRYKNKASQQPITIDDDEVEFVEETILPKDARSQILKQSPVIKPSALQRQHQKQPSPFKSSPMQPQQSPMQRQISPTKPQQLSMQHRQTPMQTQHQVSPMQTSQPVSPMQVQYQVTQMQTHQISPMQTQHQVSPMQTQHQVSPMQTLQPQLLPTNDLKNENTLSGWNTVASPTFNLWESPTAGPVAGTSFRIFEQSLDQNQPKGSAMKTAFKDLNADELAETGSRGGMDIAVTAQATDSAKPMPAFGMHNSPEDNQRDELADETVNTNVFYLNAMTVSTPQNKRSGYNAILTEDEQLTLTKKQLFSEPLPKTLSTIFEETKSSSCGSRSSGSTNSVLATTTPLGTISEEHNNYLAQNLQANAALRYSLLGNLMDFGTTNAVGNNDDSVSPMHTSTYDISVRNIPEPANVKPLDFVPSDPFKSQLISSLLERVSFPGPHTCGYFEIPYIPRLCVRKEPICIGEERYVIDKQLGKGTFGTVYKAVDLGTCSTIAMKYQKPANKWEFYICREIQSRLAKHPLKDRFMDIPLAYFGDQASLIISDYIPGGSLLDLANMHKQKFGKTMKECLVVYFCIQMLQIVHAMHEVKIIHADIKPDNFLVFVTTDNKVGLQLIDFGCSIDMSLFPPNASFMRRVTTEDFICCEMLDGRPWNYHTDMFCIAATAHVLLFDTYIKLQKKDNLWSIQQRFPRYLKVDLWNMFFSNLLNQQTAPADSATLSVLLDETLDSLNRDSSSALPSQMRNIVNLLKNR